MTIPELLVKEGRWHTVRGLRKPNHITIRNCVITRKNGTEGSMIDVKGDGGVHLQNTDIVGG